MNYELNKKLKDAGFPYAEWQDEPLANSCGYGDKCPKYHQPSLSELIEGCGKIFLIGLEGMDAWQAQGGKFHADRKTKQGSYKTFGNGRSPEEAVANLWLELNKK